MTSNSHTIVDSWPSQSAVAGGFTQLGGEDFYEIQNHDRMAPFLMSVVSSGDHWLYISSTGGLTAGRVSAENCLFPYLTVDRLHDCHPHTGPLTLIRPRSTKGQPRIWQPFIDGLTGSSGGSRRLLKHVAGDQVVFEEVNESLALTFRYGWRTSSRFGIVRTATLENHGSTGINLEIVDGLQNLCPSGVPLSTDQRASCLVDAYKHNEIDPPTGMGIFSLTAQILDRAEAAEVLRATTVWQLGLPDGVSFLSQAQLREFCSGGVPQPEMLCTGQRANFFRYATVSLAPRQSLRWYLVGDVARDHGQVASLRKRLLDKGSLAAELNAAIEADHAELLQIVASADGLQQSGSQMATAHHFANVLFNNMRGGVFTANYQVDAEDFRNFVTARNRAVAQAEQPFLRGLPNHISYAELIATARQQRNTDLARVTMEYLPLTFGRRHGDPSRPWNEFTILIRDDDGRKTFHYQGNWRDIFQNWEALSMSFPVFLPSLVAKFVNASTIDGFNPYRITRDGINWEVPNPEDPWSNIGYWGDHQIIYLTKLLEALRNYFPGALEQLLEDPVFCYANVPYRIRSYDDIVANSRVTIEYDQFAAREIDHRVDQLGADGKLVLDDGGQVVYVNLVEKLLVPALAKLSNLAVDGGIWMNTQRPEWNDANNALVGPGLSMVTVCYLRRHLSLFVELLRELGDRRIAVSVEVEQWYRRIREILQEYRHLLQADELADADRGRILQAAGQAFSDYRLKVYDDGFSGKHTISSAELVDFLRLASEYLDRTIRSSRRADRLFHAYNLLDIDATACTATVAHLDEMLEGQTACLSSGLLDAVQTMDLLDAMFDSRLYREDQRSFMLYPHRELPGFLERNVIGRTRLHSIELLRCLAEAGVSSIAVCDVFGEYHFHPAIQRQADLVERLDQLARNEKWSARVDQDRRPILELFEDVFQHKTYTGRSGTMYGYEGLGCIYWHMVSKLLLAIQENVFRAVDRQAPNSVVDSLADAYYLVRGGLSSDKTPSEYGAFPADPYSHTPKHAGAQQPGMTGQVKEEILTRQGELGIRVRNGQLRFQPVLLRQREFCRQACQFNYYDLHGEARVVDLAAGSLAFTFCQTPIVYSLGEGSWAIDVSYTDDRNKLCGREELDAETSQKLFQRSGEIAKIDVNIPSDQITRA